MRVLLLFRTFIFMSKNESLNVDRRLKQTLTKKHTHIYANGTGTTLSLKILRSFIFPLNALIHSAM